MPLITLYNRRTDSNLFHRKFPRVQLSSIWSVGLGRSCWVVAVGQVDFFFITTDAFIVINLEGWPSAEHEDSRWKILK
jgi:hypothetical protein